MDNSHHTWYPSWSERLEDKVRGAGFRSISELLASMPVRPYEEVARVLGTNVVPIQVISAQFQEAKSTNALREAALDSLCRHLIEKLPLGWGFGEKAEFNAVHALGSWISEIEVTGGCTHLAPQLLAIAKDIRETPPPDGWTPSGSDDSFLIAAFARHWTS